MKRIQIIFGLLLLCILCGCNNPQLQLNQKADGIEQDSIYALWFAKTDGDCCFVISTTDCYFSELADGFYHVGDKLIVYHGSDCTCGAILEGRIDPFINRKNKIDCDIARLIDTTLLLKECPAGYPDENSDEALYTIFDPYGKIFKVNGDSLEMIYCGCL